MSQITETAAGIKSKKEALQKIKGKVAVNKLPV